MHFRVRPGFYCHRNGSVLSPGAIIEAEPSDVSHLLHQLEEVEVKATLSRRKSKPPDAQPN